MTTNTVSETSPPSKPHPTSVTSRTTDSASGDATPNSASITPPSGVQVSPAPLSDDEALQQYLKQLAEEYQITDPPNVPIIRRIKPDESLPLLEQCLTSSGFPITQQGPYGYKPDVPAAQMPALHLAQYKCAASYPLQNRYLQPAGLAYYEAFYDYEVNVTVPCLAQQGYPQTNPVPTLQTYLSELGTPHEWHAINVIGNVAPPKLYDIQRACPSNPPADKLFPAS